LDPRYTRIALGRSQHKTLFPNNSSIVIEVCLPRRCTEVAVLLLRECSFPREPVYRAVAYQWTIPDLCHNIAIYNTRSMTCLDLRLIRKPWMFKALSKTPHTVDRHILTGDSTILRNTCPSNGTLNSRAIQR
jgi:hypothetical protein